MSWGYLVHLDLELPEAAWADVAASALPVTPWPVSNVSDYFVPRRWGGDTVGTLLARTWSSDHASSAHAVTRGQKSGRTTIGLMVHVDRANDLIYEVGTLPGVLATVARAGGSGSLVVVSDGSGDGPSWKWSMNGTAIKCSTLSAAQEQKLVAELLLRMGPAEPTRAPAEKPKPAGPFARRPVHFEVAYRASEKPQTLDIEISYARPPLVGMAAAQMRQIVTHITMGATGGAEFAPRHSSGRLLSGPIDPAKSGVDKKDFHWKLDVRGMSPFYVRHIVARMKLTSNEPATSMVIRGALPVDDSAAAVRTETIDAWMLDDTAWTKACPDPGFAIKDVDVAKGMKVRLTSARPPTDDMNRAFASLLMQWSDACAFMPKGTGPFGMNPPKPGKSKTGFSAASTGFELARKPPRDQLVNFLIHFHDTVCPLVSAELAFPG